jgi:hypothetical protein
LKKYIWKALKSSTFAMLRCSLAKFIRDVSSDLFWRTQ